MKTDGFFSPWRRRGSPCPEEQLSLGLAARAQGGEGARISTGSRQDLTYSEIPGAVRLAIQRRRGRIIRWRGSLYAVGGGSSRTAIWRWSGTKTHTGERDIQGGGCSPSSRSSTAYLSARRGENWSEVFHIRRGYQCDRKDNHLPRREVIRVQRKGGALARTRAVIPASLGQK